MQSLVKIYVYTTFMSKLGVSVDTTVFPITGIIHLSLSTQIILLYVLHQKTAVPIRSYLQV